MDIKIKYCIIKLCDIVDILLLENLLTYFSKRHARYYFYSEAYFEGVFIDLVVPPFVYYTYFIIESINLLRFSHFSRMSTQWYIMI